MSDTVLIVSTISFVLVAALNAVPRIIWALRCKPDSPNYKHPPPARLIGRFGDPRV